MNATYHKLSPADQAAMQAMRAELLLHPALVFGPEARPFYDQAICFDLVVNVFLLGSAAAYRNFAEHIAARAKVVTFIADYRLVPEHGFQMR